MIPFQHKGRTFDVGDPSATIAYVHFVLGGIDLDPAACAAANKTVGARSYLTPIDDGLSRPWTGRVFVHPPSSERIGTSRVSLYWRKLTDEYVSGNVHSAFFVGFESSALWTPQGGPSVLDFAICLPRTRLRFLQTSEDGQLVPQSAQKRRTLMAFLPPRDADYLPSLHRFYRCFQDLGWTGHGHRFRHEDFAALTSSPE